MRLILLFAVLLFVSCYDQEVNPDYENLITEIETIDGIRHDFDTEILSFDPVDTVFACDSFHYFWASMYVMEELVDEYVRLGWGSKTREEIRAEIVPELSDIGYQKYEKMKPDSVLLVRYRAKVKQDVFGIDKTFDQLVYVSPGSKKTKD